MYGFSEAGRVLVQRTIDRDESGIQGMAGRLGMNHMRLRRAVTFGGRISKEEMGYIASEVGWPMKYLVK